MDFLRNYWPWPGPDLSKTGPNLILVVGGSLDVIESTSFSSPTGFPDPPDPPGDPPDPPREVLDKFVNFSKKKVYPADAALRTCNLLAVTRGRFAATGDGSRRLNGVLMT